jgi:pimeloyl-ACP methyl ester carboxylesterase
VTVTPARVRFYDVHSADGTRLRAWTNDAQGPTVLLCNGLGTNPNAWPSLTSPDCGVRIISWNHRGTSGSDRPKDRSRVDLDAFVEDALAVMDDAGVDHCVVMGWSAGVTIAFELAGRFPERVDGIFAVAGVPGNTLGTSLRPLHLPGPVAKAIMTSAAHVGRATGRYWGPLTTGFPITTTTANLMRWTRLVDAASDPNVVREVTQEIITTSPDWYSHLALGVGSHRRVSLSSIDVPVTMIAGTRDILTSAKAMKAAAARLKDVIFIEIDATHFIPFGAPELVLAELKNLLKRVEAPTARPAATTR